MTFLFILLFLTTLISTVVSQFDFKAEEVKFRPVRLGLGFLAMVAVIALWSSFVTVDTGTRGIVTKFGQVNRTLDPGAHLVLPFAESVHPITTQTLVVKPHEQAASLDQQVVYFEVTLAYHFEPKNVGYIYSQLADSSDNSVENKVIIPAILEAIKSNTAKYTAVQLISERPTVRDGIETVVTQRLAQYHIIPETVSITDFHFSDEYEKSIEAKVTAQQNAEKAQNDLQRVKIEAEQKVAAAEGEAAALKAQKEQITPELLQLRMIEMMKEKWDGALPQNYYGGQAPLPIVEAFKKGTTK